MLLKILALPGRGGGGGCIPPSSPPLLSVLWQLTTIELLKIPKRNHTFSFSDFQLALKIDFDTCDIPFIPLLLYLTQIVIFVSPA